MLAKTSRKRTYTVEWMDSPVQSQNKLYIHMEAAMTLAEAAEAFDGLTWIERIDENEGNKLFYGYSRLAMARIGNGKLTLMLEREGEQ